MPKIHVLPGAVSELIAAGEVIERPASIVKELVENSVDAGASAVTVELQNGGIRYLRVTDNGCGIAPEDAPTAFLRHATSKVRTAADLDAIGTLGFRGEALASVAAVAHVEMLTRQPESPLGVQVKVSASEVTGVQEAGCPAGTTIVVRDVFYNVPARLKFLKKDVSEANAVQNILEKIALSHPEISFKLIRDGRTAFHTPGDGKLESVIYTIFGREFTRSLIPVEYSLGGVSVSGFVSKPTASRPNRTMQHFFVNGRYTRTKTGAAALEEGFRSSMMVGKFPACVLNLTLPCNLVDVNVHPAKIEVRFVSEKSVFDAVYFAAKSAIAADNALTHPETPQAPQKDPSLLSGFLEQEAEQQTFSAISEKAAVSINMAVPQKVLTVSDSVPAYTAVRHPEPVPMPAGTPVPEPSARLFPEKLPQQAARIPEELPVPDTVPEEKAPAGEPAPSPVQKPQIPPVRVIGELFATYILAQLGETFVLIDKHAAHERILYNRLKESGGSLDRQYLLTALPVTLSHAEHEVVMEQKEELERLGFVAEDFGGNMVKLRAVPAVAGAESAAEMFLEVAAGLAGMKKQDLPRAAEEILHRIACRSAVKANDRNSMEELQHLAEEVCADEDVRYCPHGRPVMIRYSRADLEKLFGRIQ